MNFLSLSSIFTNVTKSFSASFWLAGVFPSAAFLFTNAAMLYLLSSRFRAEAGALWQETTVSRGASLAAFMAMAILLLAYTLTALATRLRKLLEGDWPPLFLAFQKRCVQAQVRRRREIESSIHKIFGYRRVAFEAENWRNELASVRGLGSKVNRGKAMPSNTADPMQAVKSLWNSDEVIPDRDLEIAVRSLQLLLLTYDADHNDSLLDPWHLEMNTLIAYAIERAEQEHFQLYNRLRFGYGSAIVAPTEMGNIAASIQAYAVNRYHFNLELFWSSLQKCVLKDKDFAPVLEDAKTRLDFLIVSFWLTVAFWLFWALILPLVSFQTGVFMAVIVLGPLAAYLWHRAAVEQYRAFADAVKTTIDLFRLDLLDSLRLRRPSDVEDERDMWKHLNGVAEYGEEGNFRFEFPAQG